jgi:hypothetical protein
MNSALIAVIVEQFNKIVELESRIAKIDKANTDLLGQYVEAAERARELEIELNAKPDVPEPEDAYLSDFRVLKTAIEIVSYAMKSESNDYKQEICRQAVRLIKSFTENVRLWDGLDDLEPYLWGTPGSREEHLVDREWKK